MVAERTDIITSLRAIADELERSPALPTPTTTMVAASLPEGHGFLDVLEVAEALAPCEVQPSALTGKAAIVRWFGPILFQVLIDTNVAGSTRKVIRPVERFFPDVELTRAAAEGKHR